MIAPKIVTEIRRLLAEESLSQRRIAQLVGVSRGTVGAIASGRRPDYEALHEPWEDELDEPAGPPERCPSCGGMVYMPCRLCRTQKMSVKKPRLISQHGAVSLGEPRGLCLRPEHQARYEEVRAWRRQLADVPKGCY